MRRRLPLLLGVVLSLTAAPVARAAGPVATPSGGPVQVVLRLRPPSVLAGGQLARARSAGTRVVDALPQGTTVLWRTSTVYDGVAVSTDRSDLPALEHLPDVAQVVPLVAKSRASETAGLGLVHAADAWSAVPAPPAGAAVPKVAVIDTGLDYLHTDFGGPGAGYASSDRWATRDTSVVPDGTDLAGDAYDGTNTAVPDSDPMDCSTTSGGGHGTHVAGLLAGRGVSSAGATYTGPWDSTLDPATLSVPPGVDPHAQLLPVRVFGCTGTTTLVTPAIEWAVTHGANVIQLSLGRDSVRPDDPDSVAVAAASAAGVLSVVSAGNSGNAWSEVGSPGTAPSALTVAATDDGADPVDELMSTSGNEPASFGRAHAQTSTETGQLATGPISDGCSALPPVPAAQHLVAVESWDAEDATRVCSSAVAVADAAAAGYVGAVLVSTSEDLAGGIAGVAGIPSALVGPAEGADLIAHRGDPAGVSVTWSPSGLGQGVQARPGQADHVAPSSSRGTVGDAAIKPEVAAPGVTMTSAASGSGHGPAVMSGTSMAAPMAAGVVALLLQEHPTWTPAMLKAAVVTTTDAIGAAPDVTRTGTGRIRADQAVATTVLAGTGTVSFGDVSPPAPTTVSRTVTVTQTAAQAAAYSVSTTAVPPGMALSAGPAVLDLGAGSSADLTVSLTVDPAALDPAQPDLSALLTLTPQPGTPGPPLHLAVGGLVRSGAATTAPSTLVLDGTDGFLPLSGTTAPGATVGAFTLLAAPSPVSVSLPSQAAADLQWIGSSSSPDHLALATVSRSPAHRTSVTTADAVHVQGEVSLEADLDVDGDGLADDYVWLVRGSDGVLRSNTYAIATHALRGSVPLSGIIDDRDTALALLLVPRNVLPAGASTVGVTVFDTALSGTMPVVTRQGPFTVDLTAPAARPAGTETLPGLLARDQSGPTLAVSAPTSVPLQLLVLHPAAGSAQVLTVRHAQSTSLPLPGQLRLGAVTDLSPTSSSGLPAEVDDLTPSTCQLSGSHLVAVAAGACRLSVTQAGSPIWAPAASSVSTEVLGPTTVGVLAPAQVLIGQPIDVEVRVPDSSADGAVQLLVDGIGTTTGALVAGQARLVVPSPPVGTHTLSAVWTGDALHPGSTSAATSLVVIPLRASLRLGAPRSVRTVGRRATVHVTVRSSARRLSLPVTVDGRRAAGVRLDASGRGLLTLHLPPGRHVVRTVLSTATIARTTATALITVRSRR